MLTRRSRIKYCIYGKGNSKQAKLSYFQCGPFRNKKLGGGKSFIRRNSKWKALIKMAWLMITIITLIIINSNNNDKSNK